MRLRSVQTTQKTLSMGHSITDLLNSTHLTAKNQNIHVNITLKVFVMSLITEYNFQHYLLPLFPHPQIHFACLFWCHKWGTEEQTGGGGWSIQNHQSKASCWCFKITYC